MVEQLNILKDYLFPLTAFAVLSALVGYLYIPKLVSVAKKFKQRPPVIKKYWYFVIPFTVILVALYSCLFAFVDDSKVELYTNVLNQFSTLAFAVFIGYFSFLQVIENRADKLKTEAHQYLSPGVRDYARAVKTFEEIVSIEPNDFFNLANLLEAYLMQKDFQSFDSRIGNLEKCIFTSKDKLIYYYILILYYLLKGHHDDADRYILELVQYTRANSEITMNWNFGDFKKSDAYSSGLRAESDSRRKFDNVIAYISKVMTPENRTNFETGDYILRVPTV